VVLEKFILELPHKYVSGTYLPGVTKDETQELEKQTLTFLYINMVTKYPVLSTGEVFRLLFESSFG